MLGGASNALTVAVTSDRLIVRPIFPFVLMFMPELTDLEHDVARNQVVAGVDKGLFGDTLRLRFLRPDGRDVRLDLRVRRSDELVALLGGQKAIVQ